MSNSFDIVASIVTYKNDAVVLNKAILSFLSTDLKVYVLISDNSPTDKLKGELIEDPRVGYLYNNSNLGFGKAHNLCIYHPEIQSKYHLILNPDVYFDGNVLNTLFEYLESNKNVGMLSPKIVYPDDTIQLSCRLLPSPMDMLARRIPKGKVLFKSRIQKHQYEYSNFNANMEVPFLLGCFLLVRSSLLKQVGGFDDRYFMYMEDLDLCRRIGSKSKIIYYAEAKIYHIYERASAKQTKLFLLHLKSMIKYFNKWGWLFDSERKRANILAKRNELHYH